MKKDIILAIIAATTITTAQAAKFAHLDEATPQNGIIDNVYPVFDFDDDGCYPATGISRNGEQNPGLKTTGALNGHCHDPGFLDISNTFHRYACKTGANNSEYCGHFYALYFEKDQALAGLDAFGHRHDWEHVAIWTTDGKITHASASAHGKLDTKNRADIPFEGEHPKFVYHKEGVSTHSMRFAMPDETAENDYGYWVTPTIVSWYEIQGNGLNNEVMRYKLNRFDYGNAILPIKDSNFRTNLNSFRPKGYPEFSDSDIVASKP
ncbi:NPP1 family protein [Endozoicomonas sp. Mp262]|uniref:NPP1 family protein n=1 Tax=Endozoicomonas sp. Mp262 TaxID=2919499 RepID=UPI0021D7E566